MSATATTTLTSTLVGSEMSNSEVQSLQEAQARIAELESQVQILTLRATSAVEQANEYEANLRKVTAQQQTTKSPPPLNTGTNGPSSAAVTAAAAAAAASSTPPTPLQSASSRFARLISSRVATATGRAESPATGASTPDIPAIRLNSPPEQGGGSGSISDQSLLEQLSQEQALRKAAESAAAKTNSEIEELTGQLFEQANEMVAAERKARKKLEDRVEVLEKRDNDKARRLGLLEMRVQRVERVRGLLERDKDAAPS